MTALELVHQLMQLDPDEEVGAGLFSNGDIILRSLDTGENLALWPAALAEDIEIDDPRPTW